MIELSDEQFHELIDRAFDSLPQTHRDNVQNVAIITADYPSPAQREQLHLHCNETLLGLYEGIPLPQRQGRQTTMPDVITLFKFPLLSESYDEATLYENIRHTLWHEIAHYYGLDHDKIHELEQ